MHDLDELEEFDGRNDDSLDAFSEEPTRRVSRSGGRRGIPLTDMERRERHRRLYGDDAPDERLGNPGQELITPEDETLIEPVVVVGAIVVAAGVHAIDKWREKKRREKAGLPGQPQLAVVSFKDPRTGETKFRFTITGTYPGRRIMLKIGKGALYGYADPVIADRYGDGTIELSKDHILEEARRKKIIDIGMPKIMPGTKRVWMYVQESRPRLGDIRSPIAMVEIEVKGLISEIEEGIEAGIAKKRSDVAKDLLGFVILSVDEAKELINAGKPCFIKSILPIISLLPGLPYTPGMWVPWLCVITDIQ